MRADFGCFTWYTVRLLSQCTALNNVKTLLEHVERALLVDSLSSGQFFLNTSVTNSIPYLHTLQCYQMWEYVPYSGLIIIMIIFIGKYLFITKVIYI